MRNLTVVLLTLLLVACGAQKKTQKDEKLHSPPEDDTVVMPDGPPIIYEKSDTKIEYTVEADGVAVTKSDLDSFIAQGPPYALSVVTVEPFKEGKKMVGFQIVDLTQNAEARLKPHLVRGDVITHINGLKLRTPDDYFEAWKTLTDAQSIRVDFVRDGEAQNVVWMVK